MKWDSIQQVLRIVLFSLGGWLLGDGVADSEMYQQAVGGLLSVGSFVWWMAFEKKRPKQA